jgi:ferrochelatase
MSAAPLHQANGLTKGKGRDSASAPRRRGVLLLNLGTPAEPDAASVRRYLTEFLSDPQVIRLPRALRWMNLPLARLIAQLRAPRSAEAYRSIWTDRGSPLKVITEDQVRALQARLPDRWQVFYAMRYGEPSVASALEAIVNAQVLDVVVVPMYPQFSGPTTGTAVADLYRQLRRCGQQLNVTVRNAWFDDVGYVDAQARLIQQVAQEHRLDPSNCVLLYSAHSMPESYIRAGDPYQQQVLRTVHLVTERLGWPGDRMAVSYQSKLGPVPWLSPSTQQSLLDFAAEGEENVLVCPISFTADCLETLEEIGIGYRELVEAHGASLHLCPALNTYEPFIKTLSQLVLRGARSVEECHGPPAPLMQFKSDKKPVEGDIDSLVMIGVSLPPRLDGGEGPPLRHITPQQFKCVKKPHEEVTELLRRIRAGGDFEECWLWNTCSRFEFYGWLKAEPDSAGARQAVDRTAREVLGAAGGDVPYNVMRGAEAWHHLLRTAAGLNSGLPGDGEVTNQLQVAHRIAGRCETAGPRIEQLADEVLACQDELREHTSWGRFRPEYCAVALKRVALTADFDWPGAECVIIGGSVTARSVLNALRDRFDVPARQITAVHRTHCRGMQIKRLRAALGNGKRLRVDTYQDARVLAVVAAADIVICAIDSRTPILDAAQLADARDRKQRPLTIIDFNTFGSTVGMETQDGVRLIDARRLEEEVGRFSDGLVECPAFAAATAQAESWIRRRLAQRVVDGKGRIEAAENPPLSYNGACAGNGRRGIASAVCPCARENTSLSCPKRVMTGRIAS